VREGRQQLHKLHVTVVSGRTLNNEHQIYGYCLHYSECKDDLLYFLNFLKQHGLDLNKADMTIITDRGTAIAPAVAEAMPLAYHHFCPKHLERNIRVITNDEPIIGLYWKARGAVTQGECMSYMDAMSSLSPKVTYPAYTYIPRVYIFIPWV
jgi:hypothetical protein